MKRESPYIKTPVLRKFGLNLLLGAAITIILTILFFFISTSVLSNSTVAFR